MLLNVIKAIIEKMLELIQINLSLEQQYTLNYIQNATMTTFSGSKIKFIELYNQYLTKVRNSWLSNNIVLKNTSINQLMIKDKMSYNTELSY